MTRCEEIRKRFRIDDSCCPECHKEEKPWGLLQGGKEVEVCCRVVAAVEIEGAYCDIHGEWYPPGLQCLSCKKEK